jgi:hypothetical protein
MNNPITVSPMLASREPRLSESFRSFPHPVSLSSIPLLDFLETLRLRSQENKEVISNE